MRVDEGKCTARGTEVEVDGRAWDIAGSAYDVRCVSSERASEN